MELFEEPEQQLSELRARQQAPAWRGAYRATRSKAERKLAHMVRPGRYARRREQIKVDADWSYIGAGTSFARMARIGLTNFG